jgi:meiotic recombination protein SPO11
VCNRSIHLSYNEYFIHTVLRKCRGLRDELRARTEKDSILGIPSDKGIDKVLPYGVPSDIVEVADLPATQVLDGIEYIAVNIANQVLTKKGFYLNIPSRASTNQVYVKEWDRIVLGGKRSTRRFLNVKESRKTAITVRVMQLLHSVLMKKIHITKRDLFYTDVKLFVEQAESDGVLDDIATMIGCTRSKYVLYNIDIELIHTD